MEDLDKKYESATKALATLEKSIALFSKARGTDTYEMVRDSVIQRFEYSIDTFWKLLKVYLQDEMGIDTVSASPRGAIKESLQNNVMTYDEYLVLLKGIADRNLTSHTYNEDLAEDMVTRIANYYEVMHAVVSRLEL